MIPSNRLPSNKQRKPYTRTVLLTTQGAFAAAKDARIARERAGKAEMLRQHARKHGYQITEMKACEPVYVKGFQARPKLQHALNTDTLRQMGWLT